MGLRTGGPIILMQAGDLHSDTAYKLEQICHVILEQTHEMDAAG